MTHATKVLKSFIEATNGELEAVKKHSEEAKEAYVSAVEYFGESSKTTSPQTFFGIFARFASAYKKAIKVMTHLSDIAYHPSIRGNPYPW